MKLRILLFAVISLLLIILLLRACSISTEDPMGESANSGRLITEEGDSTPLANMAPVRQLPETGLVTFTAEDGLTVTAHFYKANIENAPCIILFHQAGSSRGEYHEIAPRLNSLGYNCLAVDQRAGEESNDVSNITASAAKDAGLEPTYIDAWLDLEAALAYTKNALWAEKIIIWGSSYSAALVFVLASEYPQDISALLAFSPGEYFDFKGKKIGEYAANTKCPVFITSEAEGNYAGASFAELSKYLYDQTPSANKAYFLPDGIAGKHGSSVLWRSHTYNEIYWQQVSAFLKTI